MKKTLGGGRLGSGKKMQVEMHGYERSTHDMGYVWRSTMAPGTLVPFMADLALPGDAWEIELNCNVLTLPTIGPLFGSFKVQLDLFETPIRLYHAWLHNNKLNIGRDMSVVKLPLMRLTAYQIPNSGNIDNTQVNPSCILAYLGIRGIGDISANGLETETRDFHAVKLLGYWDIYKNYYANKQEGIGAVVHTGGVEPIETVDTITIAGTLVSFEGGDDGIQIYGDEMVTVGWIGDPADQPNPATIMFITNIGPISMAEMVPVINYATNSFEGTIFDVWTDLVINGWRYISETEIEVGPPRVQTFPLANIDSAREEILERATSSAAVIINDFNLTPYDYVIKPENGRNNMLNTQEGLALKTYQSDVFNNWLDTDWIDGAGGITELTRVSTAGGYFTIDNLNLAQKLYDIYNRVAASGGSYDDWMDAIWATERYTRAETPIYHGGLSKELIFQEVVSNAQVPAGDGQGGQPLGTLAGRGKLNTKHKGGKARIRVQEPSYLWGIISLTPRIDYSQGNRWDVNLRTMDDLHQPGLDQIGFQESINEYRAWWTTHKIGAAWVQTSAGKQPAWIDYMTDYNRTYGNFAIEANQMWMTLNRRFENLTVTGLTPTSIKDLTTYIDPAKYNFIFAETEIDAQNFWVQIAVNRTVRRIMSAKIMPSL